ncbi:SRPBCC family protein [Microbacterium album]|uniref:Potassium-transporting ATPase subunit F n=1 Tax=Microbacterium album TaxID=2053191 RepID=A0A917MND0_9MICO|nr:SRPBCC family protein [Microbacterium album]GGH50700.1 potassium-transporting ATPase subunit F [Microbacterium album]
MASYTVSRSVIVDAEPEQVFPLITRFSNWTRWSPFENADPALAREYRGPDEGTGAVYEWSGNDKAGAGVMTITDVTPCQVYVDLEFVRPFTSSTRHVFAVTPSGGAASTVTWTMHGEHRGLTGLVTRLLMPMEKVMGPEFEKGLEALKLEVERDVAEADAA